MRDLRARIDAEKEADHWRGVAYALAGRIEKPEVAIAFLEDCAEQCVLEYSRRSYTDAILTLRARMAEQQAKDAALKLAS